jgi:Ca2+-transporting ATPase
MIVNVPFLNEPFSTLSLPRLDWIIVAVLALTVSPVLELAKWMERRGWFGEMS